MALTSIARMQLQGRIPEAAIKDGHQETVEAIGVNFPRLLELNKRLEKPRTNITGMRGWLDDMDHGGTEWVNMFIDPKTSFVSRLEQGWIPEEQTFILRDKGHRVHIKEGFRDTPWYKWETHFQDDFMYDLPFNTMKEAIRRNNITLLYGPSMGYPY